MIILIIPYIINNDINDHYYLLNYGKGRLTMKREYLYQLPPIDWWTGWTKLETAMRNILEDEEALGSSMNSMKEITFKVARAFYLAAKYSNWEGDIREGIYVSAVPDGEESGDTCCLLIAWKQDNNGTTFLYSKKELPWLNYDDGFFRGLGQVYPMVDPN